MVKREDYMPEYDVTRRAPVQMTAAAPDTTFRDRLAELFPHSNPSHGLVGSCAPGSCWCGADRRRAEAERLIAAEVQAAANQRTAEELQSAGRKGFFTRDGQRWAADRAAALASPAPVPPDANGGGPR